MDGVCKEPKTISSDKELEVNFWNAGQIFKQVLVELYEK